MNLEGIIFDFDGTLADTLPLCINSFKLAYKETSGIDIEEAEIVKNFGLTEEGICKNLLADKWEEGFKNYLKFYKRDHHLYPGLFNGMENILNYLRNNNFKLALVTGKGKSSADITLDLYGVRDYFEFIETGSEKGSIKTESIKKILKKWNIPPENVAYVGDAISDIKESKAAGVNQISVSWATTTDHAKLKEENPTKLFDKIEEFKNWIESLPLPNQQVSLKK